MKEENKDPLYVAFDSDILISLAYIHKNLINGKEYLYENFHDSYIKKNFQRFHELYTAIQEDRIRPVVVNTVFNETANSNETIKFIKDFCFFPDYNIANKNAKAKETQKLAKAYTMPYTYNGEFQPAPMKQQYNSYIDKIVPSNDAFIMAEATIAGVIFVTQNARDYIKTEEDFKGIAKHKERKAKGIDENFYEKHSRALGIIEINKQQGYTIEDTNIVPRPYEFTHFMDNLRKDRLTELSPREPLIKADSIMGDD